MKNLFGSSRNRLTTCVISYVFKKVYALYKTPANGLQIVIVLHSEVIFNSIIGPEDTCQVDHQA